MANSPSRYFNTLNFGPTQKLAEDLVIEAIRIHGVTVYYIPKELVNLDKIFGEDGTIKYETAIPIEVYIKNAEGFGGQGKMLSKLGIEIHEEIVLTMSTRRFEEIRAETILLEDNIVLEQEKTYEYASGQTNPILMESGNTEGYFLQYSRPKEGDLIYLPFANKIFDIKYVDNDAIFYQFGNVYTFEVTCEVFEYSNERINTGYEDIDLIEDIYTTDMNTSDLLLEDGSNMLMEDTGSVILESYHLENVDATINNTEFEKESSDYIDFSEKNPFVRDTPYMRW